MNTSIQSAAERAAREFLEWYPPGHDAWGVANDRWIGPHFHESDKSDKQVPWRCHHAPGPTPDFFFALWGECLARGWIVGCESASDAESVAWIQVGPKHRLYADGDPREALIRCVNKVLDDNGGDDDDFQDDLDEDEMPGGIPDHKR